MTYICRYRVDSSVEDIRVQPKLRLFLYEAFWSPRIHTTTSLRAVRADCPFGLPVHSASSCATAPHFQNTLRNSRIICFIIAVNMITPCTYCHWLNKM